ncbi:Protease synthase and sporulation protein PAI 2 (plasmid) [Asticcacaulis sp. MM231]|uniref:FMN-binding negative transcriptional regulator n=1 Tax=Asticcacaulis sp. MM231 TaxID=3157666 RepID=UPI0032D5A3E1
MDPKPAKYVPKSPSDLLDLIKAYPFAWIISTGGTFNATPLPIRPIVEGGHLVAMLGHFGRNNPQVERLRTDPFAHLLILGPHGYISPSWLSDKTQAPTWNYASATFACRISLLETAAEIGVLLRDLIDTHEEGRPNHWSLDDMGARAERLARGVVGFRADIVEQQIAFKLGQDEQDLEFSEILTALETHGPADLATYMRWQNPNR